MKILVLNGPNLNMLGIREQEIYGKNTYKDLEELIKNYGKEKSMQIDILQSNCEGELVTIIQNALNKYDGIVINAGAYTHYSYAILDSLYAVNIPTVEVHISNIYKREEFRHKSVILPACKKQISGLGIQGYIEAIKYLQKEEKWQSCK